jgi:hypothetical protein
MTRKPLPLLRALSVFLLAGAGLPACGGGGNGDSLDIAEGDKMVYQMDCQSYCDAGSRCGGQAGEACLQTCGDVVDAGALQSGYVDALYDCVTVLADPCTPADVDGCIAQARGQCGRADNLDAFFSDYCDRFLTCQDYDPETWREDCIYDLETSVDFDVYVCSSRAAVDKLFECVAAASCQQLETVAVLDLCVEIYR